MAKSGHNVVLVNFNYRVGALGFLGGEEVKADGDLNIGLLDQRFAMKWVKNHITSVRALQSLLYLSRLTISSSEVTQIMLSYMAGQLAVALSLSISPHMVVATTACLWEPFLNLHFFRYIRQ